MPTFEDPAADADQAQQALRGLAHATFSIDDPRDIYPVLGSLTAAAASLSQSLHQLAAFHDQTTHQTTGEAGGSRARRAAAYQVSWELHRAGDILRQVRAAIEHAHQAEARIAYDHQAAPSMTNAPHRSSDHGIGL